LQKGYKKEFTRHEQSKLLINLAPEVSSPQIIQASPLTKLYWHGKADNNLPNIIPTPSISNHPTSFIAKTTSSSSHWHVMIAIIQLTTRINNQQNLRLLANSAANSSIHASQVTWCVGYYIQW